MSKVGFVFSVRGIVGMGLPRGHGTRSSGKAHHVPEEKSSTFRFTKDTEEYKLLEQIFRSGAAKASDRPSDIYSRYEAFKKININSFRAQYNKLKNLLGIGTKAGKSSELPFESLYIRPSNINLLLYCRYQTNA